MGELRIHWTALLNKVIRGPVQVGGGKQSNKQSEVVPVPVYLLILKQLQQPTPLIAIHRVGTTPYTYLR